ncbi:hypothetical protein ACFQE6_06940 [Natrinema soli]|uniref:Uncharacterized protein n=1 Tax=Natrinema soli TaxID=1930624 RepID=A0ABD5SIE0_9EURY
MRTEDDSDENLSQYDRLACSFDEFAKNERSGERDPYREEDVNVRHSPLLYAKRDKSASVAHDERYFCD